MRKALFIGGTGTISTAIVKRLSEDPQWEVFVLNRGNRKDVIPSNVNHIIADINDEADVLSRIGSIQFDVVGEFARLPLTTNPPRVM